MADIEFETHHWHWFVIGFDWGDTVRQFHLGWWTVVYSKEK